MADKVGVICDALGLDQDEQAALVARGVVRLFIKHPELYGWHDPIAHEALRLAKLALAATTNEQTTAASLRSTDLPPLNRSSFRVRI